jgi:hypothetical protein
MHVTGVSTHYSALTIFPLIRGLLGKALDFCSLAAIGCTGCRRRRRRTTFSCIHINPDNQNLANRIHSDMFIHTGKLPPWSCCQKAHLSSAQPIPTRQNRCRRYSRCDLQSQSTNREL